MDCWTRHSLPQAMHDRGGHLVSHRLYLRPLGVPVSVSYSRLHSAWALSPPRASWSPQALGAVVEADSQVECTSHTQHSQPCLTCMTPGPGLTSVPWLGSWGALPRVPRWKTLYQSLAAPRNQAAVTLERPAVPVTPASSTASIAGEPAAAWAVTRQGESL